LSRRQQRAGFALVIALVMMAMLLVLVISLVMFLALELRFSTTVADRQVARLNALYSLRLAVAQLQQEAGPDQRVTAQANVTIPTTASSIEGRRSRLRDEWKDRNPYYTGVWHTREKAGDGDDDPTAPQHNGTDLPPAWLVSGEKQFNTPAYASNISNYEDGYKVPWTRVRDTSTDDVILFRALPADFKSATDYERFPFDTRVTAAKVAIKDSDNNTVGNFAYWVGDEGVKARLNTQNVLTTNSRDFSAQLGTARYIARAVASGRAAFELYPEWDTLQSDDEDIVNALTTASYAAHKKLDSFVQSNAASDTFSVSISNLYAHDVTAYSQGILTDVRNGGLKWDLSLAFELPWNDFKKTAFYGTGSNQSSKFNATINMDASTKEWSGPGYVKSIGLRPKLLSMPCMADNKKFTAYPVWNVRFTDWGVGGNNARNIRGPTWNIMRDFYRLYKNTDANDDLPEYGTKSIPNYSESGVLLARSHYPGIRQFGGKFDDSHWLDISHKYNSEDALRTAWNDIIIRDFWWNREHLPFPRPLKVSTATYISHYSLVLALRKKSSESGELQIVGLPVYTLRNPYNVPVLYQGGYLNTMRFGCPTFTIDGKQVALDTVFIPNLQFLRSQVPEQHRTIQAGKTMVFSGQDTAEGAVAYDGYITVKRGMSYKGGVFRDIPTSVTVTGDSATVGLDFRATDSYYNSGYLLREYIWSWPDSNNQEPNSRTNSDGKGGNNGDADSGEKLGAGDHNCTEQTEIFMIRYNPERHGQVGPAREIAIPTAPNSTPFAVTDYIEKPLNWSKLAYGDLGANNGWPCYIMSNPLSLTRRPDSQANIYGGRGETKTYGYVSSSVSWTYRWRPANSWEEALETGDGGTSAFAGSSLTSQGQNIFVSAYLPREPMVSIGQFHTANIDPIDHHPLYAVGESFPTPFIRDDSVYDSGGNASHAAGTGWTNYDYAWLMNASLWDHYFFSSIAPEVDPRGAGIPKQTKSQEDVWDEFRDKNNKGKSIPLANQHFVYNTSAKTSDANTLLTGDERYNGYRKAAMFLYQNGTFNINSTSEFAWRTILGSTRNTPVTVVDGVNRGTMQAEGENKNQTPFPRVNPILKNDQGGGHFATKSTSFHQHAAWRGSKALDDDQIKLLAKAVVEKLRKRLTLKPFEVPYKYDGLTLSRPFFSLAEFINRTLTPFGQYGKNTEYREYRVGVIQAAINYADMVLKADINSNMRQDGVDLGPGSVTRLDSHYAGGTGGGQGAFPYPEVVELADNAKILMASGAIGTLIQGDIFEAIGAKISARSDTFTIRAYGDTTTAGNASQPRARAYVEAVVQRTPEYVDSASNEPFIHPQDNLNEDLKVENKSKLTALNKHLGRRFRIVSLRFLTEKDL
jgi:hypothetical protein